MKVRYEEVILKEDESFQIGVFQDNLSKSSWHYHNSYEISFITEGTGKRIVADSMVEFHPGDLIFIGGHLPHVWIADKELHHPSGRTLEMVSLHFTADVIPEPILELPEFRFVAQAVELAQRGMQIVGDTLNAVSEIMLQLPYQESFERMMNFYSMMNIIGRSDSNILLASDDYLKTRFQPASKRIAIIHDYLMNHFQDEIDLKKLADLVNMAEGSLCRYFKSKMKMTLFEYLNQIKVESACKLLMNRDLGIIDVSLDSGFNNLSHFNKQFKKVKGMTPSAYRKQFRELV